MFKISINTTVNNDIYYIKRQNTDIPRKKCNKSVQKILSGTSGTGQCDVSASDACWWKLSRGEGIRG